MAFVLRACEEQDAAACCMWYIRGRGIIFWGGMWNTDSNMPIRISGGRGLIDTVLLRAAALMVCQRTRAACYYDFPGCLLTPRSCLENGWNPEGARGLAGPLRPLICSWGAVTRASPDQNIL